MPATTASHEQLEAATTEALKTSGEFSRWMHGAMKILLALLPLATGWAGWISNKTLDHDTRIAQLELSEMRQQQDMDKSEAMRKSELAKIYHVDVLEERIRMNQKTLEEKLDIKLEPINKSLSAIETDLREIRKNR